MDDGLVVAGDYLDRAKLHLDRVDPTLTTSSAAGDGALDQFSASQQVPPAPVGLERARTSLRAAQQTIADGADGADDVARRLVARAGEGLRLLERLCAMVDELSGYAARNLVLGAKPL